MTLDNLEYISIQNQTSDFPKHYHETFCITLINKGIFQIDLDEQSLYNEPGTIIIANPYEIHSNPVIDTSVQIGFDTIYISKDLMKYLNHGKDIVFINRKITNAAANCIFIQLKNAISLQKLITIEYLLLKFTEILNLYSEVRSEEYSEAPFKSFSNIGSYIDNNITSKFYLDELSRIANLNKFCFAKKFKEETGMSPMNYILMKKIFSSKKLITRNTELTQLAFEYEFSDMAHFSNTFKRYIGISPKAYQNNIPPTSN